MYERGTISSGKANKGIVIMEKEILTIKEVAS
jgi:hypothetical protein